MEQNSGVGLNLEIKLYTTSRGSDMTRRKIRRTHGESRALAEQLFTVGKICLVPEKLSSLYDECCDKCAWPPRCHDGEGISVIFWLKIITPSLIAMGGWLYCLHRLTFPIFIKIMFDLMFEDTKYHGYSLDICPLKLQLSYKKTNKSIIKNWIEHSCWCFTNTKYLSFELLIRNQQVGARRHNLELIML